MKAMPIWRHPLLRLDRDAIYQIGLYLLAVNLVCNTWVVEYFLGAERMGQLSIRTVIWSFHGFSLAFIAILLQRRNRPAVTVIDRTILTTFLRREQVSFLFVLFCNNYELEELQHGATPVRLQEINGMLAELDVSVFRTMDLFVPATLDASLQSLYRADGHHSQAANQHIAQALVQFVRAEFEGI